MRNKRWNYAVNEVLGTALLLAMAVMLFSLVQLTIFTYPYEPSPPSVSLVGTTEYNETIDERHIIIQHIGGEALSLDTKILITVNGEPEPETTVEHGLDHDSKENNLWNIGEKYIYPDNRVTDERVEVSVVDVESNTIIMRGTLQK